MLYYKAKVKCKIENDKRKVQKVTEDRIGGELDKMFLGNNP